MPYIKQVDREKLISIAYEAPRSTIEFELIETAGELQYAMAVMFKSYMDRKGLRYQNCNDVMGALAGAQMEFYRRVVGPYEDSCIKRNGDV